MRTGWKKMKLGELSGFQGGAQPPKSAFSNTPQESYVRLLQIRDFKNDSKAVYIPKSQKNRICEENDIMIGRYGASVGQIHRGKGGAYNVALIKTIPNLKVIIPGFYYYYLTSPIFQEPLMSVADRSAQAGFGKKDIVNFDVPLPPLSEQKRIVAILDEAFAGIDTAVANTKKNLANARELFESYLNSVFSQRGEEWSLGSLEELCFIGDGNHSAKYPKKSEMVPAGIAFIRATNLIEGGISDEDILYITEDKHLALKKGHLKAGDVLFSNRGEIGKVAIVSEKFDGANLNSQLAWFRSRSQLLPEYLFYFLQSRKMKLHFLKSKSGAALQQFTIRMIKSVSINYPSLGAQSQIVEKLDNASKETRALEAIYQQKLAALAELKQSLLQKAFSGELTAEATNKMKEATA